MRLKHIFYAFILVFVISCSSFAKFPFNLNKLQQNLEKLQQKLTTSENKNTIKNSNGQNYETGGSPAGQGVFGSTKENPFIFVGNVYFINPGTDHLPNFKKLIPVGRIYTPDLNIKPRRFDQGFPGISKRFEWFAIDYRAKMFVPGSKTYKFSLLSDDGAKLLIDGRVVINNDGIHPPIEKIGYIYLKRGIHKIEVQYFQGPRYYVALELFIYRKGRKEPFDIRKFAPVTMKSSGCKTRLTLSSGILFDFNSYSLKSDAIKVLDQVYNLLKNTDYKRIVVEGYTDNIGSKKYNLILSRRRAQSVANYLIAKGIPEDLVSVVGYGESHPRYPNDTEGHRALNRRVEIVVYKHCINLSNNEKVIDGVVEVYKNDVYVVVNPTCRCRVSYRVLGGYKNVLKRYAGKEVKVRGVVKKTSPWSGTIYVDQIL